MPQTTTIIAPDQGHSRRWLSQIFRARNAGPAVLIAIIFAVVASSIIIAGRYHSSYRLSQYITQPIHARVDFVYFDRSKFITAQQRTRELEPRVYRPNPQFSWTNLEDQMRRWPEMAAGNDTPRLPDDVRSSFKSDALALLAQYASPERRNLFNQRIDAFSAAMRKVVVIPAENHAEELARHAQWRAPSGFGIRTINPEGQPTQVPLDSTYPSRPNVALAAVIDRAAAEAFREDLAPQIAAYVLRNLQPTHVLEANLTQEAQERAAAMVLSREGEVSFKAGVVIKPIGEIDEHDLGVLKAEHLAYRDSLGIAVSSRDFAGIVGAVAVLTAILGWYVRRYQTRIVRNHARTIAIAVLLISMMLISQLAASGTRPLYAFGIAPTILTAMILAIAYEPRLALGVSMILGVLVTLALGQGLSFLLVLAAGCATACAFTSRVRTRGRLIEIGMLSAMAMCAITMFSGVWALRGAEPFTCILQDAMFAAAAGLTAGFVVLGILPTVEKVFRITTGMTLLELSDASHPLQRKMATESPGTYSHVLQVATLAETAAEAIGADSLLTRVGALYHDIGKSCRPHYFIENQHPGDNAHMQLSPNVSFMIILEHLKDGLELAKQYKLPTSIHAFIQQHHGTTLVEYFYHQACKDQRTDRMVHESSFRYPGPKPHSKEVAIVMLADACESATRTIQSPTPDAIEKLVQSLIMKRMLDGQLSDCELTMRELHVVEKTLTRTLQSIYHARIAYPETRTQPILNVAGAGR